MYKSWQIHKLVWYYLFCALSCDDGQYGRYLSSSCVLTMLMVRVIEHFERGLINQNGAFLPLILVRFIACKHFNPHQEFFSHHRHGRDSQQHSLFPDHLSITFGIRRTRGASLSPSFGRLAVAFIHPLLDLISRYSKHAAVIRIFSKKSLWSFYLVPVRTTSI